MGVIVDYDRREQTYNEQKAGSGYDYYVGSEGILVTTEIPNLTPSAMCDKRGLDTIYITAAGYINYPFKGASRDSELAHEEPTWSAELERSVNGVLANILDVDYTLVVTINITYKYMNVQDYKALCKIARERVCRVTYYDRDRCEWVVNQEFAFTQRSIGDLYVFGTDYFGVQDVAISLVATNRDRAGLINSKFYVTYYRNDNGEATGNILALDGDDSGKYTQAEWGGNVVIAPITGLTRAGYTFKYWSTGPDDYESDERYPENSNKTLWKNMELYAVWEKN